MSSFELIATFFEFIQALSEKLTRTFTNQFDRRMKKLREALEKLDNATAAESSNGDGDEKDSGEPVASSSTASNLVQYNQIRDKAIADFKQIIENRMEANMLKYLQEKETLLKMNNFTSFELSNNCYELLNDTLNEVATEFAPLTSTVRDQLKAKEELLAKKEVEYIEVVKATKTLKVELGKVSVTLQSGRIITIF